MIWIIRRVFNSFTLRLAIILCLSNGIIVGLAAISLAVLTGSMARPGLGLGMLIIVPVIAALLGLIIGGFAVRALNRHLRTLSHVAREVAAGRLEMEIGEFNSEDSLGDLFKEITRMQTSLRLLVNNLISAASNVESSAVSLNGAAKEATRSSETVSETMGEMTSGINDLAGTIRVATDMIGEMATQINQTSKTAETVGSLSVETLSSAETGLDTISGSVNQVNALAGHIGRLVEVITDLRARSTEIDEVVQLISSIAEQTNLLALNASIEAAHAGEFGATFGVLAERIQALSNSAAEAGGRIGNQIQRILDGITKVEGVAADSKETFTNAVSQVNQAGEHFARIAMMIKDIAMRVESVAENSGWLIRHSDEVNERMQNIAAFSEEIAASIEEVAASAEEQTAISQQVGNTGDELVKVANGFKGITAAFVI